MTAAVAFTALLVVLCCAAVALAAIGIVAWANSIKPWDAGYPVRRRPVKWLDSE